jgi:hypothetical protein
MNEITVTVTATGVATTYPRTMQFAARNYMMDLVQQGIGFTCSFSE